MNKAIEAFAMMRTAAITAYDAFHAFKRASTHFSYQSARYSFMEHLYLHHHQHLPGRKGNPRQRKKAFKKAEHWYYTVHLKTNSEI